MPDVYMPELPKSWLEVVGKVPFRPLRRMVDRTGALQRGCVGVAVRVGVELTVAVGVREAESVADDDELV